MEAVESAATLELAQSKAQVVGLRKKGSNNLLIRKLFSRQPNVPKITGNDTQARLHEDLDSESEDDMLYRDLDIAPCPYIRPSGFKLEPRVELYAMRQRSTAAIVPPVANAVSSEETPSDSLSHRDQSLREEIVAAAAANPTHVQAWAKYLKCYTEVSETNQVSWTTRSNMCIGSF